MLHINKRNEEPSIFMTAAPVTWKSFRELLRCHTAFAALQIPLINWLFPKRCSTSPRDPAGCQLHAHVCLATGISLAGIR